MNPRPTLPPACLVRSFADIRRALEPGLPATLLSASGAALFLGPATWRAMVEAARADHPPARFDDILDCGDASGRALEALRLGQRCLALSPHAPGWDDLAARATGLGRLVLPSPPLSLDLGLCRDHSELLAWLGAPAGTTR